MFDKLFSLANLVAMIGWLLLSVLPRWRWTQRIVISGLIPLLLGSLYLALIVLYFGDAEGNFGSLSGVMQLFTDEKAVLAGWIHYLAFDLFIGTWEVSDSRKHNISHWFVVPCLFLTFMFGPVGLITYFVVRAIKTRKVAHENF